MTACSPLLRSLPGAALVDDSRRLKPGAVFFAYPGESSDGRRYIPEAIAAGAAGILWERDGFAWRSAWNVPNEPHEGLRAIAGELAAEHHGHPSSKLGVVAITGTKGKTTTSWFAAQLLAGARVPAGYIGTLGIMPPDWSGLVAGEHTTPPAMELQGVLADFAAAEGRAAVLEASSQGLSQDRLAGTRCKVGAITNIGHDHYDYHGGQDGYRAAKRKLLMRPELEFAVVNRDDPACMEAAEGSPGMAVTVGRSEADVAYRRISLQPGRQQAQIMHKGRAIGFLLPMLGEFNIANAAMAYAVAMAHGANLSDLENALQRLQPPPGRLQRVPGSSCAVFIDYAHTPESLQAALAAVCEVAGDGTVACVFGCSGDRDQGKRSKMGEAASAADCVFVTSDNPRDEDPAHIAAEVAAGVAGRSTIVLDRREAIRAAIAAAGRSGAVLIAGKGHETQMLGPEGSAVAFSDYDEAAAALEESAWA